MTGSCSPWWEVTLGEGITGGNVGREDQRPEQGRPRDTNTVRAGLEMKSDESEKMVQETKD